MDIKKTLLVKSNKTVTNKNSKHKPQISKSNRSGLVQNYEGSSEKLRCILRSDKINLLSTLKTLCIKPFEN